MEVLPLGADVDLCNEIQNDKKLLISLKNKYNILGDSKVIVTGGKLTPRKKVELLIEAFRTINNNKYHLIIIGGSSDVDDIYIKMLKDLSKDTYTRIKETIINIDTDRNLLVVKGAIPGANQGMVIIQQAKRLNRKKTAAVS